MVSSVSSQAFFGLPPKGLRPKQLEEPHSANSNKYPYRPREPRLTYGEGNGSDDWYDVFGTTEEEMEVDLPHRVIPCQRPGRDVEQQEPRESARSSAIPNDPESNTIHLLQTPDDPIPAEIALDIRSPTGRLLSNECLNDANILFKAKSIPNASS
jgi:hypothetical protein